MEDKDRKPHEVMMWDTLNHLWKAVGHSAALANEIDELYANIDAYLIDKVLIEKYGVNLRKLREICDELTIIHRNEYKLAEDFEKKLNGI